MIQREAYYDHAPSHQGDYKRYYENRTGKPIRVTDNSGRVVVIPPIPSYKHELHHGTFSVIEWFRDCDAASKIPYLPAIRNIGLLQHQTQTTANPDYIFSGVKLVHRFPLDHFVGEAEGIYFVEGGIHLIIDTYDFKHGHPNLAEAMEAKMEAHSGFVMSVEILDQEGKIGKCYMNLGGVVHTVVPKRTPIPTRDGVIIRYYDEERNMEREQLYPIIELFEGDGHHGIRLYREILDAKDDIREPKKAAFLKEKREFEQNKERVIAEAVKRAREQDVLENAKIRRAAEEKLQKAHETVTRHHESRQREKTGLLGNALKLVGSVFDFFKGLIF